MSAEYEPTKETGLEERIKFLKFKMAEAARVLNHYTFLHDVAFERWKELGGTE